VKVRWFEDEKLKALFVGFVYFVVRLFVKYYFFRNSVGWTPTFFLKILAK
jgi:hypothetical protein